MSVSLTDVRSGYNLSGINSNFEKIEEELNNNVLRRDGLESDEANQMNNNLDMNGFSIHNAYFNGVNIDDITGEEAKKWAEESQAWAEISENWANLSDSYADRASAQADLAEATVDELNDTIRNKGFFAPSDGAYPLPDQYEVPCVWFSSGDGVIGNTNWTKGDMLQYTPSLVNPAFSLGTYTRVAGELTVPWDDTDWPVSFENDISLNEGDSIYWKKTDGGSLVPGLGYSNGVFFMGNDSSEIILETSNPTNVRARNTANNEEYTLLTSETGATKEDIGIVSIAAALGVDVSQVCPLAVGEVATNASYFYDVDTAKTYYAPTEVEGGILEITQYNDDLLTINVATPEGTLEFEIISLTWKQYREEGYIAGWGVTGDGSDETTKLARVFKECRNIDFRGLDVMVSVPEGEGTAIMVYSDTVVDFGYGSISLLPNSLGTYRVLGASKQSNCEFNRGAIYGDLKTHTGTEGESGHGLYLESCKSFVFNQMNFLECWGDGAYLRSAPTDTNYQITFNDCIFDNNRRQGASLIGGVGIFYNNCHFTNTGQYLATAPAAGIDIEQNASSLGDVVVKLNDCHFSGNIGGAYQIIQSNALVCPTLTPGICRVDVSIQGCTSYKDGDTSTIGRSAIRMGAGHYVADPTNTLVGGISISNQTITRPGINPIWFSNYAESFVDVNIDSLIINDNYCDIELGEELGSVFQHLIYIQIFDEVQTDATFDFGKIHIEHIIYNDSRGDTFSTTATNSNHRVKRVLFSDPCLGDYQNISLGKMTSNIKPENYYIFNCNIKVTPDFYSVNKNYDIPEQSDYYGHGLTFNLEEIENVGLFVFLPETSDYYPGQSIRFKSFRDVGRLRFKPTGSDVVIYKETNEKTSEIFEPKYYSGVFEFYSPVKGLWVQV